MRGPAACSSACARQITLLPSRCSTALASSRQHRRVCVRARPAVQCQAAAGGGDGASRGWSEAGSSSSYGRQQDNSSSSGYGSSRSSRDRDRQQAGSGRGRSSSSSRGRGGGGQRDGSRSGHDWQPAHSSQAIDPPLLTARIKATTTPEQLQQLVQQHGAAMNHIHIAAAVTLLGQWKARSGSYGSHDQSAVFQLLGQLEQLLLRPQTLQQCGCRELANMLWAICALRYTHTAMYSSCMGEFMRKLPAVEYSQHITNVLYGAAECGKWLDEAQVQQLLAMLVRQDMLHRAEPHAFSNTLWGVATMKHQMPEQQLQLLLAAFTSKLSAAAPQEVSNTLWACAVFNYLPGDVLAVLTTQPYLDALVAGMNPQGLANTALACAQLGHRDDTLMGALVQRAGQLLGQQGGSSRRGSKFTAQGVCNLVWSVVVLDLQQHAAQLPVWVQAACQQWATMVPEALQQLYQTHLWLLDCQLAGGQGLARTLTEQQLEQSRAAWAAQHAAMAAAPPSQLQRDVFSALSQLHLSWQQQPAMEQLSQPDGALLIDITGMTADGMLLAFEVDGPWHFRRPDRQLTGPTQYRNRALAARGYTVVSVPYRDWDALRGSEQQQQYLRNLIDRHLKGQRQPGDQQQQQVQQQRHKRHSTGDSHAGVQQSNS